MSYRDESHWMRKAVTTRHSQGTLLLVSLFWGLSYCMPPGQRIIFSEVFPDTLSKHSGVPMWGWGVMLLVSALAALVGERAILGGNGQTRFGWRLSFISHAVLAGVYFTLAVSSLEVGVVEVASMHWAAPAIISAMSRPVLWSYIGYLHVTYARLPRPALAKKQKKQRKYKLFVRVDDD